MTERRFLIAACMVALLCALPVFAVVLAALTGTAEGWQALYDTVLPRYAGTTVALVFLVACGTALIGVSTAWLVTTCRFPGVRVFEIMLALPLAFPAYVLAYAYTDFLDHPGPVQTLLRDLTGWGPRDYWFPEIRSLGGAAFMLTLTLYPYVYLLARAAFLQQSFSSYTAARVLGKSPWMAFWRVSLPMARPAIAGGVLLAVMETIADFGTVAYFGVQTFATGIYQAWFSLGDRTAAAQLALCLLTVALFLAILERIQRGRARRSNTRGVMTTLPAQPLRGVRSLMAVIWCLLPVLFGFALPTLLLGWMAQDADQSILSPRYLSFTTNSVMLAGIASVATIVAAIIITTAARLMRRRLTRFLSLAAGIGYAVPGGVIAVGLLVPLAHFDNALDTWMRNTFDVSTGLLLTGSIWVLVMAYVIRFIAAALSATDTGNSSVNISMDAAARTLGQSPSALVWRVHLPLMKTSLLTGMLIVFVDVMKELPATLIMRPFNFDTLAVQAHRLAADERLDQAAVPSLVILAFGLLPVIILCRTLARASRSPATPQDTSVAKA